MSPICKNQAPDTRETRAYSAQILLTSTFFTPDLRCLYALPLSAIIMLFLSSS
jgi:hypothetical protein